ncbi:MAG: 30S ribosomal protein S16 [Proteobacteria bacterium]|nr:30S ribosomal protein S16 [Pseudomonadota bacterium]
MAVKIRLARHGKKKRPFYRIVVTKDTSPRDGRFIELLGTFDPCTEPAAVTINKEKALSWLRKGAQPTQSVIQILKRGGVFQSSSTPSP